MDSDKIKNFVLYNFEKLIVVLVILLSGFLVYAGLGKPDITQKRDPDELATRANRVKLEVDEDHNEGIIPDRRWTFDIAKKQDEFNNPIPANLYLPRIWDGRNSIAEKVRRQDPGLGKPQGIQAMGVIASMAYRSKSGLYALTELEPADELEVIEQKPKRQPRRSRRNAMMDGGMDGGYGGMDMEMDMDMDMEMSMDMGMDMGMGLEGGAAGANRKAPADYNLGYTPSPTKDFRSGDEQLPVPGMGLFIAGSAAIPHKELIASYQEAFSNAADYEPRQRDRPEYLGYQIQRADVTTKAVDQLTDADWTTRDSNIDTIKDAATYWSGFAKGIVPADYFVPGVTMWIPPVTMDPYNRFSTNPLVPLRSQRELDSERALLEAEKLKKAKGDVDMDQFEVVVEGGQSQSYGAGYGGMDGGYGGMDMDMDMEMGMDDGYGGMGGMGGGSGMAGKPAEDNPVDFKLLRFYDFAYIKGAKRDPNAPKLNRKYVYRIRFAVNDPNFPKKPELQPKGKTLDPDAYTRVSKLTADAQVKQKRNFMRWSEWSELSAPVSLPKLDASAVGVVKSGKARSFQLGNRTVLLETEPPKAEVVASSFDPRLGVFVPTLMEATEGTVLSAKVETADVVDPITLEVKKTEEKVIESAATIIDVEGGLPMEIIDDDKITEPGMFLMVDSDGNLKVRDSVEEQRVYRVKSFAKERGL